MVRSEEFESPTAGTARTNAKLFDFVVKKIKENERIKLYFIGGIRSYNLYDLVDIQYLFWKKKKFVRSIFLKKFANIDELIEYVDVSKEIDLKVKISIVRKYLNYNIRELIKVIENHISQAQNADYILTTGHKSKGLEWDKVQILNDFVNLKEEIRDNGEAIVKQEELNLLYVAITRSKNKLLIHKDYLLDKEFLRKNRHLIKIV